MLADPIKIIMLSEYPFDESEQGLGGIMQSTFQLVQGFVDYPDKGIELHVVSFSSKCNSVIVRQVGEITCHFVPASKKGFGLLFSGPARMFRYVRKLKKLLKSDLIHGQGTVTCLVLSIFQSKKNIQTIHGIYRNELSVIPKDALRIIDRFRFFFKLKLENFYLKRIRNVISITSQIQDVLRVEGRSDIQFFRINNAIDGAFFEVGRRRQGALNRDEQMVKMLFVAAITPRKGLHHLVNAFRRLTEAHAHVSLTVVGIWDWAPEYVADLRANCADLIERGRVDFTGGVSRERLIAEFEAADILVLPSLAESAPMVISQAMCAGLTIVASAVGGIPEMIEDGVTGRLVPAGDEDGLFTVLNALTEDASSRKRMAEAARAVGFERYHASSIARATAAAYRVVAGV